MYNSEIITIDEMEIVCSDDSIIELEKPPKPAPPVVELDDDSELVLNILTPIPEMIMHPTISKDGEKYNPLSESISPYHWTNKMRQFYNADWGNEQTFIVSELQKTMKHFPWLWEISPRDAYTTGKRDRCRTCGASDHLMKRCPERFRAKMCHMCGDVGHRSLKCPKSGCLTCGALMKLFMTSCNACKAKRTMKCIRCNLHGHSIVDCTDNWRRFHKTVSGGVGDLEPPEGLSIGQVNKPWIDLWCCNCGEKGHDAYYCPVPCESDFPIAFPFVVFYEKNIPNNMWDHSESPRKRQRYVQNDSEKSFPRRNSTNAYCVNQSELSKFTGSPQNIFPGPSAGQDLSATCVQTTNRFRNDEFFRGSPRKSPMIGNPSNGHADDGVNNVDRKRMERGNSFRNRYFDMNVEINDPGVSPPKKRKKRYNGNNSVKTPEFIPIGNPPKNKKQAKKQKRKMLFLQKMKERNKR